MHKVLPVAPGLHRKIMRNPVTLPALGGLHGLGMRLSVAPGAPGDLPVLGVAVRAGDGRVFCDLFLKHTIDVFVTPRAYLGIRGLGIGDLQRLVHGMAGHTRPGIHFHVGTMGFVARAAFRNEAVLVGMAVRAGHIGLVLARKGLDLFCLRYMTQAASAFNMPHGNAQRLVGIYMARQTWGQCFIFSMKGPSRRALVTPCTLGHDLIIVLFSGVIDMVLPMATHAVELVLATVLFDGIKHRKMASATFDGRKGLNLHLVGRGCFCSLFGYSGRGNGPPGRKKKRKDKSQDSGNSTEPTKTKPSNPLCVFHKPSILSSKSSQPAPSERSTHPDEPDFS